jgi:hypothetical protein
MRVEVQDSVTALTASTAMRADFPEKMLSGSANLVDQRLSIARSHENLHRILSSPPFFEYSRFRPV